jgi:spore germination cell wall hydrolase CwlJ-like protein
LKDGTPIEHNKTSWRDSVNGALMVMSGQARDNTGGATYYYAHNQVYPDWADKFTKIDVIGNHTFMKR